MTKRDKETEGLISNNSESEQIDKSKITSKTSVANSVQMAKNSTPKRKNLEDGEDETLSDETMTSSGRAKRRLAQCVVNGCQTNENSLKYNGQKFRLFDPPKDKAGRLRWSLYVPDVDCAVHRLRYCKVCELHFVDREPSKENPLPTQNLHPSEDSASNTSDNDNHSGKKTKSAPACEDKKSDGSDGDKGISISKQSPKLKSTPKAKKMITAPHHAAPSIKPQPVSSPAMRERTGLSKRESSPVVPNEIVKPPSQSTTVVRATNISVNSILKASSFSSPPPTLTPQMTKSTIKNTSVLNSNVHAITNANLPKSNFTAAQHSTDDRTNETRLDPCQHCGIELLEIRKDLVRVENKIEAMSTLLRSVLQRTMQPTSRPTSTSVIRVSPASYQSSIVLHSPDAHNKGAANAADDIEMKSPPIISSNKPMKIIINSRGHVTASSDVATGEISHSATTGSSIKENVTNVDKSSRSSLETREELEKHAETENDPESNDEDLNIEKAIARAALLFTGRGLTLNHLKEYGPTWLTSISQDEIQSVFDELAEDGLLRLVGERKINWPTESSKNSVTMEVYEKTPVDEVDDSKLAPYGITRRSYAISYEQKGNAKFASILI